LLVAPFRLPLPLASPAVGVGHICTAIVSGIHAPLPLFADTFSSSRRANHVSGLSPSCATLALGVGHPSTEPWLIGNDPDSVPAVRRTNGGSWYAVPFRIKPERGQVSENSLNSPSKQSCDVLHDDVARSYFANKTGVL
jgi:hypothetical protein